ncbi:PIG-L family deacetylase [Balneolaceae bacterium YR4-1]|uniref:PIG-L family deacetylase n=1 Tax=Halalkalibaculum roseum TaxID=2709311 RepID=A0A6M1T1V4_9BACT|nr:PIG-L family deacetylase [Halalkalibaculum roseum]NGP76015.1 PIG-L family deacetylase [Halalkalibaculum roseum]
MNSFKSFLCLFCILLPITFSTDAQDLDYEPKILLVTAHPDDDALFSATVFKTTHLLNGDVDLAVMTNGEGGYTYSTIGNFIYGKQLDKEEVGREYLPGIRKKEVMAGGEIVGLRNYFFFDQVDKEYALDITIPLETWNTEWISNRLVNILKQQKYDFVFTMMPSEDTHAHHKASALFALRAVNQLDPEERPIVLSTTILRSDSDSTSYSMLEGYPLTKINREIPPFEFDRTQTFGHNDQLDYNIIANWVIAEHKSQGTMQQFMDVGNFEQYWYYALNDEEGVAKTRRFFDAVRSAPMYTNPNNLQEEE